MATGVEGYKSRKMVKGKKFLPTFRVYLMDYVCFQHLLNTD